MNPQEQVLSFKESAQYIQKQLGNPSIDATIVLGSGLKEFANEIQNPVRIPYKDIPHFPTSHVQGHGHQIIFGQIDSKNILVFTGRFHYYQGIPITTAALPAWVSFYLNVPRYILTNAAGGVNETFNVGDMVLISDHINPTGLNPLQGVLLENWNNPFFDTSNLYNESMRESILKIAISQDFSMKQATYCFLPGPNFETPAEIQMLRTLRADLVGMSSVPESLAAHKLGMKVLGLSVVTNVYPAKNQKASTVSHQEVLEATQKASNRFNQLMKAWITSW